MACPGFPAAWGAPIVDLAPDLMAVREECAFPALAAALVMAAVYRAILKKIGKNPLAILVEKIRLSRAESLIMALPGWFKSVV